MVSLFSPGYLFTSEDLEQETTNETGEIYLSKYGLMYLFSS